MRAVSLLFAGALSLAVFAPARADESRRLFDFTPISASNPVVVTIDDSLQISLSELRAYRDTERLQAITDPTSLAQKRALVEDLINEYLYVDEAYRTGVDQSPKFVKQMEATRTMILTDFMSTRAINEKGNGTTETGSAPAEMADRLFEATQIDISNEAYDILKRSAKAVDTTSAASRRGPIVESKEEAAAKLHAIINATPEAVLVRYEHKTLSVRQILAIYAGLPTPRPPVQTEDGFVAMIKPLILPELMAIEAMKQGIAAEPEFRNKLVQNRNALLRFQVQGAIESRANDVLKGPDLEAQLAAWYRDHAASFAAPDSGGKKIPPLSAVKERALADFSVDLCDQLRATKARDLRKLRHIVVDEPVLRSL